MSIPEEAVNVAARIISEIYYPDYDDDPAFARRVLEAAAPHMALSRSETLRQAAAIGWDKAVESMTYEDGSKVEIASSVNPYRTQNATEGTK